MPPTRAGTGSEPISPSPADRERTVCRKFSGVLLCAPCRPETARREPGPARDEGGSASRDSDGPALPGAGVWRESRTRGDSEAGKELHLETDHGERGKGGEGELSQSSPLSGRLETHLAAGSRCLAAGAVVAVVALASGYSTGQVAAMPPRTGGSSYPRCSGSRGGPGAPGNQSGEGSRASDNRVTICVQNL